MYMSTGGVDDSAIVAFPVDKKIDYIRESQSEYFFTWDHI